MSLCDNYVKVRRAVLAAETIFVSQHFGDARSNNRKQFTAG
jgi:hypothetical protein